jgi:homeobox-leucine zipper protein
MFKECPHPDENQRAALSRELGLEPRQIKFWFQNRRTQMKVKCPSSFDFFFLPFTRSPCFIPTFCRLVFHGFLMDDDAAVCELQAQHERADNCFLRAENDKIRCENITMREALKNVICPNCGGPPVAEDYFDEQKLRMENARLKEEVNHELTNHALFPATSSPVCPSVPVYFCTVRL